MSSSKTASSDSLVVKDGPGRLGFDRVVHLIESHDGRIGDEYLKVIVQDLRGSILTDCVVVLVNGFLVKRQCDLDGLKHLCRRRCRRHDRTIGTNGVITTR